MAVISRNLERRATTISPLHPRDPALAELFNFGTRTSSGARVTPETALESPAMLSSLRYLSETLAATPLVLHERVDEDETREAFAHPLHDRLLWEPNRYQTTFEWADMLMCHLILRGNGYAELVPSQTYPPFEIIPLHPDRIEPFWAPNGRPAYEYRGASGTRIILDEEMLHLKFMPGDGLRGRSVISYARETIGLSLAAEEYGATFFDNDARPGGYLKHPGNLSAEAQQRLINAWEDRHRGRGQNRKTAVLEEGMTWEQVEVAPEDSQFLETRKELRRDQASINRVPPHKIGDLERATFSNIEHQSIEAVIDTLRPWYVRWQMAIRRDLLTQPEKARYFARFDYAELLRGDQKSEADALSVARQNGIINADEWRRKLGMNPQPDGLGRVYYVPLNMIPAQLAGVDVNPPDAPAGPSRARHPAIEMRARLTTQRLRSAYAPAFEDAARRVLRREVQEVGKHFRQMAQARGLADFRQWLQSFYAEHEDVVRRQMGPVISDYAASVRDIAADRVGADPGAIDIAPFAAAYTNAYAARHVAKSRAVIIDLIEGDPDALAPALDARLQDWQSTRPGQIAAAEVVQAGAAVQRHTWRDAGVTQIVWEAGGETCPLCESLDGQVVGIEREFVSEGETVEGEGVSPLRASKTLHPPLHNGCNCSISPA